MSTTPKTRPMPTPLVVGTWANVPRRLLTCTKLLPSARLIGALLAAEASADRMAVVVTNQRLEELSGLKCRAVCEALEALENHGFIWRVARGDEYGSELLRWAGFRDPWTEAGRDRPQRVIVLCWRLPEPQFIEPGRRRPARAGGQERAR